VAKWGLKTEQILQWANTWTTPYYARALGKEVMYVPKFELAKESETPHIVVVLNGKHGIFIARVII
jgi:hypothetical protein